ncbi:hypothetical protein FJ208_00235, partial [Candidatus Gribaldobacteria bacterium]|nr:hypothetical protein [Candidatus Gribaldobacteria bacterium]
MKIKAEKIKLGMILFIFFLFFALILTKLFYLQIKNSKYYQALALGQQIVFEDVYQERGSVYSSDGKVLAKTFEQPLVYINPAKIENKE